MPLPFRSPKIKSIRSLKKSVAQARQAGQSIVLANGCFDLIHVGHIRYLKAAKKKGDLLVVALNSDRSVRQLKGADRPFLNEQERAFIIASFWFVDYVTIFDSLRVDRLLRILRPDWHVKGSDYTRATVPEKDTAKKLGIKTAIVGGPKVRSTSSLIRSIAGKIACLAPGQKERSRRSQRTVRKNE